MFNHIMVGSNDIERSRRFYDQVLGVLGAPAATPHRAKSGHMRMFYRHDGGSFGIGPPWPMAAPSPSAAIRRSRCMPLHDAALAQGGVSIEEPPGLRSDALGAYYRPMSATPTATSCARCTGPTCSPEQRHALLGAEALAPCHAVFKRITAEAVAALQRGSVVDPVADLGTRFAVRAQSAWLGWSEEVEDRLVAWVFENHAAAWSPYRAAAQRVAEDFDALIRAILAPWRATGAAASATASAAAARAAPDVTSQLMRVQVRGRPLSDAEIVSVLRNSTGGDLGSIALCVGVLVHRLATTHELQALLRAGVTDAELQAVVDEILRANDPFVSSRAGSRPARSLSAATRCRRAREYR